MERKGQGALEYLLLIGGAVLVAVIVIVLLSQLGGGGGASTYENQMNAVCASKAQPSCDTASLEGVLPTVATGIVCSVDGGPPLVFEDADTFDELTQDITCDEVGGVCQYSGICK